VRVGRTVGIASFPALIRSCHRQKKNRFLNSLPLRTLALIIAVVTEKNRLEMIADFEEICKMN
jgi:hypothetical protein